MTNLWVADIAYEMMSTKNDVHLHDSTALQLLIDAVCINSTAYLVKKENHTDFIGTKTECALLVLAEKLGVSYDDVRKMKPVKKLFPFSSKKKRMSSLIRTESSYRLFCKGASEVVLELCENVIGKEGNVHIIDADERSRLMKLIENWASQGLRTLSLAYRDIDSNDSNLEAERIANQDQIEQRLTLIALVGIEDPLREEVPSSIRECNHAGIVVRMVTGDNLLTAKSIGKKCGILKEGGIALEGPSFRKLTPEEMNNVIPNLQIIARCSPEDKLILVKRLRDLGEVVAVTGDGTNDR